MPNLSTRFARFFSNEPESREQQNSNKSYSNDLFTGLGGSYYAANTNRDLQANEYGYAQASQVLVDINASLNYWEQWLDGLVWEIKDSDTDELLVDTSERGYDASARGATVYYALRRYRERFKHSYWKSLVTSDFVAGETYVYLAGSPKLTDVQWLNPLNTTPQIISGRIEYYQYTGMDSTPATLPVNRVAYRMMRRNLFDDLRGYSSILSVLDEVNLSRNAKRAFRKYFQNGMILGGIISPDGETSWTPREREQVEKDLLRNNSGMANAHNWVISPKKIFAEAFTQSDSGQNLEALNTLSQYIASAMGVPRILYGDPADATYQNLKEAKKMWWETRGIPYARDIATYHNNQIIPRLEPDSGIYIEPKTAPYEVEAPDVVSQDVNAGYISISTAQAKRGYEVDSTLDNVYLFGGLPYRLQDGAFVPMVSMVTDTPDAVEDTEDVITDALEDAQADTEPTRNAPPNTTFSSVTYNGVTVQASPVQPSDRDDKVYSRYVRYKGDERIVHWGDPDNQAQWDSDENRENFLSRHSCEDKSNPFAGGFWACWSWQENAEVRSSKALPESREAFAYIPLANNSEVLRYQRQLRALLPNDERIEWQTAPTFHITLCYATGVTDSMIDQMMIKRIGTAELRPKAIEVFDTPDGQAVHIRLEDSYTLLELQESIYNEFVDKKAKGISEYSKPENYNPHITLAYVPDDIDVSEVVLAEDVYPDFKLDTSQVIIGRDNYEPVLILNANERKSVVSAKSQHPMLETFSPLHDDAESELKAWYKVASKSVKRASEFTPVWLRGDIADELSASLSTLDNHSKNALDAVFDPIFQRVRVKAIQATRLLFEGDVETLLERARDDNNFGRTQWASAMRAIIRRYSRLAYQDGLVDGGVADGVLDDSDETQLTSHIREQSQYVTNLGAKIFNDDDFILTDKDIEIKPALWFNKSVKPSYDLGRVSADGNAMMEWVIGATEQSCTDCLRLNGQRHRLKTYMRRGLMPQSDLLSCNGFNCKCRLVKVNARARGKF